MSQPDPWQHADQAHNPDQPHNAAQPNGLPPNYAAQPQQAAQPPQTGQFGGPAGDPGQSAHNYGQDFGRQASGEQRYSGPYPGPQHHAPYGEQRYPQQPAPQADYGQPQGGQPGFVGMPALPTQPEENVSRGLIFASIGAAVSIVLIVLIWQLGIVSSLSSFLLIFVALWSYQKGSGGKVERGRWPLIGIALVGVVLSLIACVGSDLWRVGADDPSHYGYESTWAFVQAHLFDPVIWRAERTNAIVFLVFAAFGVFWGLNQIRKA